MKSESSRIGRPELPMELRATSQIQLRVTRARKAAYVRAAAGSTLAAWMFAACDEKAGLKTERAEP